MGKGVTIRTGGFWVQTPLGARPCFGTHPRFDAPDDLWVEIKRSDEYRGSEAAPSAVAQSWPRGSQIADKKTFYLLTSINRNIIPVSTRLVWATTQLQV